MCGIFGIVTTVKGEKGRRFLMHRASRLFLLSESRGKEAAGVALRFGGTLSVLKRPTSASQMVQSAEYADLFDAVFRESPAVDAPLALIGHSRLVTNGLQTLAANNQPVVRDGLVGIHNGIIVNDAELWRRHPGLTRHAEVDTECLLAIIAQRQHQGRALIEAVADAFGEIEGTASIALMASEDRRLVLATNNGSLYWAADGASVYFASERYILSTFLREGGVTCDIVAVKPGNGVTVDTETRALESFALTAPPAAAVSVSPLPIVNVLDRDNPLNADLRRCSRCILPETMPFITFDADGVCNYCHNHEPIRPLGLDALRAAIGRHRRGDGEPDCLIAVSGGRDSCYGLHLVKRELGLNPIAYTYDWGMITDLARRNQARLCGKLGVEHILVSADIKRKRAHVRRNINAWLRRPVLGMIPLFMAGDKQYFYYANKIKQQNNISLSFLCENRFERSRFKSGFCGVNEGASRLFNIKVTQKLKIASYFALQYCLNPRYFNGSIIDSCGAFYSSYMMRHDQHLQLFDYAVWDEDHVVRTLRDEYGWELASDTESTWRIGDGTAAFYNYIYFTVAGFTENDVLRSNQIREGVMSRDKALALIRVENRPRWESIIWYAHTIGFNLDDAIAVIDAMPKLYRRD